MLEYRRKSLQHCDNLPHGGLDKELCIARSGHYRDSSEIPDARSAAIGFSSGPDRIQHQSHMAG